MESGNQLTERTPALGCSAEAGGARMRDRVAARLRSHQLDRVLAAGAAPESTVLLALRARRLTSLPLRRSMAMAYRRIVRHTRDGARMSRVQVGPRRSRVASAADELTRLADALTQPGPVAARGAAQALLLLTDGTGPLYNAESSASLRACAASALEDMELSTTY